MLYDHNKMREDLLDGAIMAVSTYGIEGASTKVIAKYSKLNEAYIYRYYLDRNDLLKKTFLRSDNYIIHYLISITNILEDTTKPFEQRFREYFELAAIEYNKDIDFTRFYLRFFYSTHLDQECRDNHNYICKELYDLFDKYFPKMKNSRSIYTTIFMISLNYMITISLIKSATVDLVKEECFQIMMALIKGSIISD